jgi:hypothetical protein
MITLTASNPRSVKEVQEATHLSTNENFQLAFDQFQRMNPDVLHGVNTFFYHKYKDKKNYLYWRKGDDSFTAEIQTGKGYSHASYSIINLSKKEKLPSLEGGFKNKQNTKRKRNTKRKFEKRKNSKRFVPRRNLIKKYFM